MATDRPQKARDPMTNKSVSERLRVLATDDKNRSKAARLRDVLDDVEAALAAGVKQAAVVEVLKEAGLEMTLGTFKNTLQRLRAKRVGQPATPIPQARPKPEPAPGANRRTDAPALLQEPLAEPAIEEQSQAPSHNPKDIDAIMGSTPDLDALAKFGRRKNK